MARLFARTPWMITTILWPAIVAAIIPLSLQATIGALPKIAERLAKLSYGAPRQIDAYQIRYSNVPTTLAFRSTCCVARPMA